MVTYTIKQVDPMRGLVDYINDIKPYHTKIIEVEVEYINDEQTSVTMTEALNLELTYALAGTITVGAGGSFQIANNQLNTFTQGSTFTITGSTGNDGTYTVAGIANNPSFATNLTTVVVEETINSSTPDGIITISSVVEV